MVAYVLLVINDGIPYTYKEAVQSVNVQNGKRQWMKR
jgi:hypothetical protein